MIDIVTWRVRIGCFCPRRTNKNRLRVLKVNRWTLSCLLRIIIALSLCLILSGDVETNPGPESTIEDVLAEIRASREENRTQFETIRKDIVELRGEMSSMKKEIDEVKESLNIQTLDIDEVNNRVDSVNSQLEKLEDGIEKLERYSRRENVIFYGIGEAEDDRSDNVKSTLVELCRECVPSKEWSNQDFVRAHRLGGQSSKKPRPVIARVSNFEDKFVLTSARAAFRERNVGLGNDLTFTQREELRKLKEQGKRGYYRSGKLHVEDIPMQHPNENDDHHAASQSASQAAFSSSERPHVDEASNFHQRGQRDSAFPSLSRDWSSVGDARRHLFHQSRVPRGNYRGRNPKGRGRQYRR